MGEAARKMRDKYGARTIFLSTDSAEIVEQTKGYPEFTWLYQTFNRSHFDINLSERNGKGDIVQVKTLDDCHRSGQCNYAADTYYMLVDLALLAQGNYMVGAFTTNVARLAYELMVAAHGGNCFPPFVTVDVEWCHMG